MSLELNKEKVSLKHGYWFYFDDEGTQIAAHGSALSGKEAVFIDGEIASTKRSFSRKSTHDFQYQEHYYQVVFFMESMLKGTLSCSLYKDGNLVSATKKSYTTKNFPLKSFLIGTAIGAVFGYLLILFMYR